MLKINFDIQFHVHIHRNGQEQEKLLPSNPFPVPTLSEYMEKQRKHALETGKHSTAHNYQTALASFLRFRQGEELSLQDLKPSLIVDYEHWLKSQHIRMNTISSYMRSLRAVYNKAVEEKLITDCKPFEKAFTGYPKTEKRSITAEDIRKLQKLPLVKDNCLRLVRDIFLFCVFACGMPFVDIAFLRKSQISNDGYLTYQRRKTNQQIRLKLMPCAQEIIQRYSDSGSEYVFPILTHTHPDKAYKQYKEKLCYYNKLLKELGQQAGIDRPLTSYVSRHSWASLAYEESTDVAVISKGLGHTTSRTTYIYIKGIDDNRLDDANQRIANKIMGIKKSPPYKR